MSPVGVLPACLCSLCVPCKRVYRDILFNAVEKATGLICEICITLRGIHESKSFGVHGTYDVIRAIGGRDPSRTVAAGVIGTQSLREIETGLVLTVDSRGVHLPLSIMQGDLTRCLSARTCQITELVLLGVTGLEGQPIASTVLALPIVTQLSETLRHLHVSSCGLTGSLPVCFWTKLRALEVARLSSNALGPEIFPLELSATAIPACARTLRSLILENNSFQGELPPWVCRLAKLDQLHLNGNHFSGALPDVIRELKRLETLNISDNLFSGDLPPWLGDLRVLKRLHACGNAFTGVLPGGMGDMHQLCELKLSSNALTGSLPSWLWHLKQLRQLGVDNNQLSGCLPEQVGDLKQLRTLDAHNNQFTGKLPVRLGDLKLLVKLDVRGNSLGVDAEARASLCQRLPDTKLVF